MSDLSGMYRTECANCKALSARVAELEASRDSWKRIAEKRHAIMLGLEWTTCDDRSSYPFCDWCNAAKERGHNAGCVMAEAIAESARAANGGGE